MPHLPHALGLWKQPTEDVSKAHQTQSSDNRRTAGQNMHAPKPPYFRSREPISQAVSLHISYRAFGIIPTRFLCLT